MRGMHDKSPGFRSAMSEAKAASCDFVGCRAIRSDVLKQIFRAEDGEIRIVQDSTAADVPFDEIGAGNGTGMIGALGYGWPRPGAGFKPQLIRN